MYFYFLYIIPMDKVNCILCGSTSTSKNWTDRKWEQRYRCNHCWRTFFAGQTYYSGTNFAEELYNTHYVYGIPVDLLAIYYGTTVRKINAILKREKDLRESRKLPYHLSPTVMFDPVTKKEFLPPYLEKYGKVPLRMKDGRAIHAGSLPKAKGFHIDPTPLYEQPAFNQDTTGYARDPQVSFPDNMKIGNV